MCFTLGMQEVETWSLQEIENIFSFNLYFIRNRKHVQLQTSNVTKTQNNGELWFTLDSSQGTTLLHST